MREIISKIGHFFERHVEKIMLIFVGIICVWFFFTRVLLGSNVVEYKGEKFGSGRIDEVVYEDAELLKKALDNNNNSENIAYTPKSEEFTDILDLSIDNVSSMLIPNPSNFFQESTIDIIYDTPVVGKINNVAVDYIRAAAYIPIEQVNEELTYEQADVEPNDIDLITVEAEFDYEKMRESFLDCFYYNVEQQWANKSLATPVLASVNLQRRRLNDDGSWSNWQNVPRSKIETYQELFGGITNEQTQLEGGLQIQMLKFSDIPVQLELLQPIGYQIASAGDQWFPPRFHERYLDAVDEEELQERRQASTTQTDTSTNSGRSSRNPTRGGTYNDSSYDSGLTTRSGGRRDNISTSSPTTSTTSSTDTTEPTEEVRQDFQDILLSQTTDFSRLEEPIVFWAFDDTAEPGNTYQYKIRLGAFNPVFKDDNDKLILWSDFSEVTEPIVIPEKLYFFTRSVQDTAKTATIRVYKYQLGYWRKYDFFKVGLGDAIGDIVDVEIEFDSSSGSSFQDEETLLVDFRTDAVLVDLVPVKDWSGTTTLRNRNYYEMLYSFDGKTIKHMPVSTYLTDDMKSILREVESQSNVTPEPLQAQSITTRNSLMESY